MPLQKISNQQTKKQIVAKERVEAIQRAQAGLPAPRAEFVKQQARKSQLEKEIKFVQDIEKWQTYKGATTGFGQRLFSKSPSYSFAQLKGAGSIQLPYFQGTYKELKVRPDGVEVITYQNPKVEFGIRGNPLNPEGQVVKKEFIKITTPEVKQYLDYQRAQFKGSFSKDIAGIQQEKILKKLGKEKISFDPTVSTYNPFTGKTQYVKDGRLYEVKGAPRETPITKPYLTDPITGKKITVRKTPEGKYVSIFATTGGKRIRSLEKAEKYLEPEYKTLLREQYDLKTKEYKGKVKEKLVGMDVVKPYIELTIEKAPKKEFSLYPQTYKELFYSPKIKTGEKTSKLYYGFKTEDKILRPEDDIIERTIFKVSRVKTEGKPNVFVGKILSLVGLGIGKRFKEYKQEFEEVSVPILSKAKPKPKIPENTIYKQFDKFIKDPIAESKEGLKRVRDLAYLVKPSKQDKKTLERYRIPFLETTLPNATKTFIEKTRKKQVEQAFKFLTTPKDETRKGIRRVMNLAEATRIPALVRKVFEQKKKFQEDPFKESKRGVQRLLAGQYVIDEAEQKARDFVKKTVVDKPGESSIVAGKIFADIITFSYGQRILGATVETTTKIGKKPFRFFTEEAGATGKTPFEQLLKSKGARKISYGLPTPKKTLKQRKPISKVAKEKIARQQAYDPNVFFEKGQVGFRFRSPGLKKKQFTKERVIRVEPFSKKITEIKDTLFNKEILKTRYKYDSKGKKIFVENLKGMGTKPGLRKLYPRAFQQKTTAGIGKPIKDLVSIQYGKEISYLRASDVIPKLPKGGYKPRPKKKAARRLLRAGKPPEGFAMAIEGKELTFYGKKLQTTTQTITKIEDIAKLKRTRKPTYKPEQTIIKPIVELKKRELIIGKPSLKLQKRQPMAEKAVNIKGFRTGRSTEQLLQRLYQKKQARITELQKSKRVVKKKDTFSIVPFYSKGIQVLEKKTTSLDKILDVFGTLKPKKKKRLKIFESQEYVTYDRPLIVADKPQIIKPIESRNIVNVIEKKGVYVTRPEAIKEGLKDIGLVLKGTIRRTGKTIVPATRIDTLKKSEIRPDIKMQVDMRQKDLTKSFFLTKIKTDIKPDISIDIMPIVKVKEAIDIKQKQSQKKKQKLVSIVPLAFIKPTKSIFDDFKTKPSKRQRLKPIIKMLPKYRKSDFMKDFVTRTIRTPPPPPEKIIRIPLLDDDKKKKRRKKKKKLLDLGFGVRQFKILKLKKKRRKKK